ncbi:MAG TPA: M48 family metallopeptidase [Chloroflexia bacterium]|nr:M48 family metallopeptidase [Chloroflexia bacterium]
MIAPTSELKTQNSKLRTQTSLDPERQRLAKEYAHTRRVLFFASLAFMLAGVALLLFTGWSIGLRQWAEQISADPWATVALYGVALGALYTLISLPLDFYSGYILPHRYGLSTQSMGGWALDNVKELALSAVFGLGGLELLYWLLRTWPDWWWAIMAGLVWLFMVAMAQLAPVLLMPLFYKMRPLDDPALTQRLTSLAEQAGTRVRGVYVMDMSSRTTAANAMLTGMGHTRRIILGDTLLEGYTHDEIETVLAHELAHHVHNDMPKGLVAEAALLLAGMWVASHVLAWGVAAFGFKGIADVANLPLFAVAMSVFGLVAMPAGNFMSRQMERAADRYALRVTGKSAAFRSVMLKLAGQNLSDADPPAWVRFLFHSHPSVSERIQAANGGAGGRP